MKIGMLIAAFVAVASSAQAQEWPGVGNQHYNVLSAGNVCGMMGHSGSGRSEVDFMLTYDGGERVFLTLRSPAWTMQEGRVYTDLTYHFFEPDTSINMRAIGDRTDNRWGVTAAFPASFLDRLSSAQTLALTQGGQQDDDSTVLAEISLRGSSGAVAALRECVAFIRSR